MFNLVRALIEYARPSIDFDKCEAYTSLIQFVNLNFVLRIPGSQTTEVPKHGSRTKAALRVSEDTEWPIYGFLRVESHALVQQVKMELDIVTALR